MTLSGLIDNDSNRLKYKKYAKPGYLKGIFLFQGKNLGFGIFFLRNTSVFVSSYRNKFCRTGIGMHSL
jgi:hypothetical protein